MMHHLPCVIEFSAILVVVYFHRLKINHESHEFMLESGTIANISIVITGKDRMQICVGLVNTYNKDYFIN
jgi:hypothetical protein